MVCLRALHERFCQNQYPTLRLMLYADIRQDSRLCKGTAAWLLLDFVENLEIQ